MHRVISTVTQPPRYPQDLAEHERPQSHTCMWENAGSERFWVKYQFKTHQGSESGALNDIRKERT